MGAVTILVLSLLGQTPMPDASAPADAAPPKASAPHARPARTKEEIAAEYRENLQKQADKRKAGKAGKGKASARGPRSILDRNAMNFGPVTTGPVTANSNLNPTSDPFQAALQMNLQNQAMNNQLGMARMYGYQSGLGQGFGARVGSQGAGLGAVPVASRTAVPGASFTGQGSSTIRNHAFSGAFNPTTGQTSVFNPIQVPMGANIMPWNFQGPLGTMQGYAAQINGAIPLPGNLYSGAGGGFGGGAASVWMGADPYSLSAPMHHSGAMHGGVGGHN